MIRKFAIAASLFLAAAPSFLVATTTGTLAATLAPMDEARPKLRAQTVVTGDIVRIGDLVEHAGIIANVPIFRAPDLGSSGTVPAQVVVEAVRGHALVGLDTGGVAQVMVTRATRSFAPEQIESTLVTALAEQFALGNVKDIALTFDRELRALHVEPANGELRIARLTYDARTARFDATLDVPGHAPLRLIGHARAMMDVVTISRPIARGEIIKHADIAIERRPRNEIGRDVIADREQAVGLASRNVMQPGRVLRMTDLMKPEVIQRNETVTIVYEMPGIMLTVRGKAAEGGAEGDTIAVLNEQSKRTVQGVVAGPGRVVIAARGPRVVANLAPSEDETMK